jgi:hypothetical protein
LMSHLRDCQRTHPEIQHWVFLLTSHIPCSMKSGTM